MYLIAAPSQLLCYAARENRDERWPLDDSQTYFEYCHVPAVAPADSWHDFDAGCVGECCRYNHRLEDWNWPIWFHAAELHGVGWADPSLSVDDDYCGVTGTWLGSSEWRKWNVVGALAHCAPLIAALSSLDVFESMGAVGVVRMAIAFHFVWLCLETFAALYPDPSH